MKIAGEVKESLVRAYALCVHLREAGKTDPLEPAVLLKLKEFNLQEGIFTSLCLRSYLYVYI